MACKPAGGVSTGEGQRSWFVPDAVVRLHAMGKLDPIVSEFANREKRRQAYDTWFRAQVEAALRGKGARNSATDAGHGRGIRKMIEERSRAKRDLAA